MSSGQSPRRKEQRAPLFEVQEKPLRKPPRPIDNTLDPFEDLPAAGPRSSRRPSPLLRTAEPAPLPTTSEQTAASPAARRAPAEAGAQLSRREMPRLPSAARPVAYEPYPPWEAPMTFARGRPWLVLLAALMCGVIIWMFSQQPRTFISTYGGLGFGNAASGAGKGLNALVAPPGEHSVISDPSITAASIDTILAQYGSPAAGTGQAWITIGQRYGIDPAYALAFFIHESSAGTNPGWAGLKSNGTSTHNVGNIICAGYATCYGRFRDYASWEEGIDDWYKLISSEYVDGRGAHTVEQIIPIYAPSSDNNNVPGYIQAVVGMVDNWRQGVLR